MRELRIASRPMINNILENTEISIFAYKTSKVLETDKSKIEAIDAKIKENEELAEALRDILDSDKG